MPLSNIRRPYMPELDTLRGVAVLLVFFFHAFLTYPSAGPKWQRAFLLLTRGGWTGVNLFFVLSGFLITGILLGSIDKPRYYGRFYARRARRILPAYYSLLVLLLLLTHTRAIHHPVSFSFAALSAIFMANVTILFGVAVGYAPLWSLAVEEHFYLLWPTAVRRFAPRVLTLILITVCVAEILLRAVCFNLGGLWFGPYTWLSADGLALGALLAIFAASRWATRTNLLKLSALAFFLGSSQLLISIVTSRAWSVALRGAAVNYLSLFAVTAVLWLGTGPFKKFVDLRFFSFMGYISYGLYLIHMVCLYLFDSVFPEFSREQTFTHALIRAAVVLTLATGVAYLSRETLEQYFLEKRRMPQISEAKA